ncbi:transcription factor bHLH117-like [Hibiscus syriacus]|uniref:transcription factor bHLH117-like n=1 Tax=Hibiscus syriacus TaxID=106335 RepID=UPI001923935C|nr:transcription factor bHLH117-like [Hibiscus syriacus]
MKMETYEFCSATTHPLHSHPPSPFTSSVTEFDNIIVNDPYLHPLLPLIYEQDPVHYFPPLPLHHSQLTDQDFSLYSYDTPDPDNNNNSLPVVTLTSTHLLHDLRPLHHHRIPLLPASPTSSAPKPKRSRLDLALSHSDNNNPQTLDSIVKSFNAPAPIIPYSDLARKRRQKLGEKTRCLQKLMPWDKKMDTGTMLQEAYKYVRFLQAQVSILQSMPITSSFSSAQHVNAGGFAGLGNLNRQQLLQVLINSPVAQTMLCSQGFCVFASEQLVSLHKAKERKTELQQYLRGNIN